MIDVSERMLALKKIAPKDTSVENFMALEKIRAIKSFEKYADMIRFRNFIVHRYENIDPEILFNIVRHKLNDFREFAEEIRTLSGK